MQQHPVDRLAVIRAEQRQLRREADHILAQLNAGVVGPVGQCYAASRHSRVVLRPLPLEEAVAPADGPDFDEWINKF